MTYQDLIQIINDNVYQNNNGEITGERGNFALRKIAEYANQFAGTAGGFQGTLTPLSTPTEKGIYIPTEAGTYTNAGGLIYDPEGVDEGFLVQFIYDGAAWVKNKIEVEMLPSGKIEGGNTQAVSGGKVYDFVGERLNNNIVLGDNLIDTIGKFRAGNYTGAIGNTYSFSVSNNWLSLQPIIVDGNVFKVGQDYTISGRGRLGTTQNLIKFVDDNDVVISNITGTGTTDFTPITFTIPSDCAKILVNAEARTDTGLDLENSQLHDTLMINSGSAVKPYSKFGYKLNLKQKVCYVSSTGNDDNSGTESSPIYSISKAREILDEDGELIFLDGDYYDYDLDLSAFKTMKALSGARVRFIYGHRIDSATLVDGFTKVYSAPYTHNGTWRDVYSLWQHDIEDDRTEILMEDRHVVHNGLVNRLQSYRLNGVNSIEDVELSDTPCFYYDLDSKIMYFQKVNGSDLSLNPMVIPKTTYVRATTEKEINHSNFTVLYGAIATSRLTGNLNDISCLYVNNLSGCFRTDNTISLKLTRCRAGGAANDGFNGHRTSTVTGIYNNYVVLELIDCWAHDNKDDGESCHNYCQIFVRGGCYEYNFGGCTPASGGHGYYENVTFQNNSDTGLAAKGDSLDGGVGTNTHAFSCYSKNNRRNYTGRGLDSRFINCVSETPTESHFYGTYQKINCVEIND